MIEAIEQKARERWNGWFPGEGEPRRLASLLVGPLGNSPHKAMVFFVFKERASKPRLVAKVARSREAERLVEQEYRFLTRVRAALPETRRDSVPCPIGLERIDGRLVLMQSCLPGRHLEEDVRSGMSRGERSRWEHSLERVSEWWIEFRKATQTPVTAAHPLGSEIEATFAEFDKAFELEPFEQTFREEYGRRCSVLLPSCSTLGAQHGDFCNLNVIQDGERIGVIDWAFGREGCPPWTDLYTFASTFYWVEGRGSRSGIEESVDHVFLEDNWLSRMLGRWLARCGAAEFLSGEQLALAVPMVLMQNALIGPRHYGGVRESDRSWRRRFGRVVSQWDRFRTVHERMVRA